MKVTKSFLLTENFKSPLEASGDSGEGRYETGTSGGKAYSLDEFFDGDVEHDKPEIDIKEHFILVSDPSPAGLLRFVKDYANKTTSYAGVPAMFDLKKGMGYYWNFDDVEIGGDELNADAFTDHRLLGLNGGDATNITAGELYTQIFVKSILEMVPTEVINVNKTISAFVGEKTSSRVLEADDKQILNYAKKMAEKIPFIKAWATETFIVNLKTFKIIKQDAPANEMVAFIDSL